MRHHASLTQATEVKMNQPTRPYNPLDLHELATSAKAKLLSQTLSSLPPASFSGSGIYALYYHGDSSLYQAISQTDRPIYVGQAAETSTRTGNTKSSRTNALYSRLRKHGRSISQTKTLRLDDFKCRYLVVEGAFISLVESLLIKEFHPVWNELISGFGNNALGSGRISSKSSRWDVLHAGRPGIDALTGESARYEDVSRMLEDHWREEKN